MLDIAVAEHVMACRDALLPDIRRTRSRQIVASSPTGLPADHWTWNGFRPKAAWFASRASPRQRSTPAPPRPTFNPMAIFIGPGWWFEQDARSFRLGYGFPTATELQSALTHISSTWPKFAR